LDTIYRFRPVWRLLSEDGKSGELDSQYIYFADPAQLNDPLEGYKDLFFSGDRVVWDNLFRHYVRCLVTSCLFYYGGFEGETQDSSIQIFSTRRNLSHTANELNDEIYKRLVAEPTITKYLEYLSGSVGIHQHELTSHLSLIHQPALATVFEVFFERKLCKNDPAPLTRERKVCLEHIESILEQFSILGAADEILSALFKSVRHVFDEIQLLKKCREDVESENTAWTYLRFEYPDAFSKALESLVYPNWYTACFMEGCADSSIWGTYGGNHKDVCLKFKVGSAEGTPYIQLNSPVGYGSRGVEMSYIQHSLHKVSYDKDFVRVDFFRSLGRLTIPQVNDWYYSQSGEASICATSVQKDEARWRKDYWENFYHSVTVKLKAWDREQEWRMVMAPNMMDLSDSEARKLKYDFNCLEGIIFGIKTSLADKARIIKRIRALCKDFGRSEFNFYQARYDDKSKSIAYDELTLFKSSMQLDPPLKTLD
jgi:hypothetical protein